MREIIFEIVNEYAVWGILLLAFVSVIILVRMNGQLRRLNRSLASVTGNVQEYFNVIMTEEPGEEPQPKATRESWKEERFLTKEEREMLLSHKKETTPEDEAVFQAVMQEYFS